MNAGARGVPARARGLPPEWGGALFALIACVVAVLALHRVGFPPPHLATRLDTAQFSSEDLPLGRPVALPDDWREGGRGGLREGYYRMVLPLADAPLRLAALYLPTVSQNAALFVNGVEVGNGGPFSPRMIRHYPRPLILPIPPDVLRGGENELLLRVGSEPPGRGYLPAVYFGERDALWPYYRARHALKVSTVSAFAVTEVVLAALLISVSLRLRGEGAYGWAGVSMLALTGHMLPMLVADVPVSPIAWEVWQHLCIGVFVVALACFVDRFLGRPPRRRERWVFASFALMIAATAGVLAAGLYAWYFRWGGVLWGAYGLVVGAQPLTRMILGLGARRGLRMAMMSASGALIFVLGAHDVLFVTGVLPKLNGYLIHFAGPPSALIFTAVLFGQFVDNRRELVVLNRDLEQRVQSKSAELELSYARLAELERERALAEARERLRRDVHDGLGGYLAGALSLAEREVGRSASLTRLLHDAADEMRLVIEAAGIDDEEPSFALGMLRERIERQATAARMTLVWRIGEVGPWPALGAEGMLDLLRIAQEAVSNATRHSGGDRLEIHLHARGDALELIVADNGRRRAGPSPVGSGGHGRANMRERARRMGAVLDIDEGAGGTRVTVRLPRAHDGAAADPARPDDVIGRTRSARGGPPDR